MPIYNLTVVRDGRSLREEQIRAMSEDAAVIQAQLRLAACRPGEAVLLHRDGMTQRAFGPRRG